MNGITPIQNKTQEHQPTLADMHQKDREYYLGQLQLAAARFQTMRRINLMASDPVIKNEIITRLQADIERLNRTLELYHNATSGAVSCVQ